MAVSRLFLDLGRERVSHREVRSETVSRLGPTVSEENTI